MNLLEELKRRGLVHDATAGIEALFTAGKRISFYAGFDPTADSLHIGNLVPVMAMAHLQRAGHKPFVLLGGATGMVGDPSGKIQERPLLDAEVLKHNLECQKTQLQRFLDFSGKAAAVIVNNADWFANMNYLMFLREVGKHINVAYMLSKDIIKRRLEEGISYTEFSYQLIQAYDYLYLNEKFGVELQLGGSDQWGNITTGIELIRKKTGKEVHGFTVPLLTRADGSKFGKSEGGNIWLDACRTSPYKFYQYLLNTADEDVEKLLLIFSQDTIEDIQERVKAHRLAPHLREAQRHLAAILTRYVHGEEALQKALTASQILFGASTPEQLATLSATELEEVFETVPRASAPRAILENQPSVVELLAHFSEFFPSKGEIRRLIQAGGLYINRQPVPVDRNLSKDQLLQDAYLVVQKGKKQFFLLHFED
jgi:tyrosyl-tRNA synthetase